VTVPDSPVTLIVDGYGLAFPIKGIVIGEELVNVAPKETLPNPKTITAKRDKFQNDSLLPFFSLISSLLLV
jgi:hypothetical protein